MLLLLLLCYTNISILITNNCKLSKKIVIEINSKIHADTHKQTNKQCIDRNDAFAIDWVKCGESLRNINADLLCVTIVLQRWRRWWRRKGHIHKQRATNCNKMKKENKNNEKKRLPYNFGCCFIACVVSQYG